MHGSLAPPNHGAQADPTGCDREPIHIPGSIQATGFLLGVSPDWLVVRASDNVDGWLSAAPPDLLGRPLTDFLCPEAVHKIRGRAQGLHAHGGGDRLFRIDLTGRGSAFDLALHLSGDVLILEAQPTGSEPLDIGHLARVLVRRLQITQSLTAVYREAARQMRHLTGFDRVMVYRFAPDGSGEVVAEAARSDMEPYLGLRYPASDIPEQARRLYERNWIRVIADVDGAPVPIVPRFDPEGYPLDLSLSALRTVSPVHLEYLRNMGVRASMSVSILREGRLWGLVACHHQTPRDVSFELQGAAELFGQMLSFELEARERKAEVAHEREARDLHTRMMGFLADRSVGLDGLADWFEALHRLVPCDGLCTVIEGAVTLHGRTPSRRQILDLARFLNMAAPSRVFSTDGLANLHPPAQGYLDTAAGIAAIPISRNPRDYLIFFRGEVARTVTWAGQPEKTVEQTPDGPRLAPRKSFAAWTEEVRGRSAPWSASDLRVAESLRVTLLEVILRLMDTAKQERRGAHEKQELLIAELNHRVRNVLNLIRSLIAQSRSGADSVDGFVAIIGSRIQALARAHDQLTATNWGGGSLTALVNLEASAYLGSKAGRVRITGGDVLLEPQAYTTLALVIHELTTNSAKYGSLADGSGHVLVDLARDPAGDLTLTWTERDGPPVKEPARRGFGSTIIERSIPYELKGEVAVEYAASGLQARFRIPGRLLTAAPEAAAPLSVLPAAEDNADGRLLGGCVLLVEDSMLVAMEAEDTLRALGAERVETAACVRDALHFLDRERPAFALLDVNLGDEMSLPVARRLQEIEVPFAFATGYGGLFDREGAFAGIPVVTKPYTRACLGRVATALATGSPPTSDDRMPSVGDASGAARA